MTVTVDIGVACSATTPPNWWPSVASMLLKEQQRGIIINQVLGISSALPDVNKTEIVGNKLPEFDRELFETRQRARLTDANRSKITGSFMGGNTRGEKSDWIFWMDDDTIPPDDVITRLLKANKPFVAGLYFLGRPPHNPIAYIKDSEYGWGYKALYGYQPGSMFEVDAVGMGCTLIHRSVYEKIMQAHNLYRRPDGTLYPVHKSKVLTNSAPLLDGQAPNTTELMVNGWLCQRAYQPHPEDNRSWPFYAMEYLRTEDYWFCELAAAAGVKPWIDSTIQCRHVKSYEVTVKDYERELDRLLEAKQ